MREKKTNSLISILITMYCLFPFYFNEGYLFQSIFVYSAAISIVAFGLHKVITRRTIITSVHILSLSLLLIFLFMASILSLFHNFEDLSYFEMLASGARQFILMLVPYFLFFSRKSDSNRFEKFLLLFVQAISLYVFFSLVLMYEPLRNIWQNIIYYKSDEQFELSVQELYYSRYGLQGFSGFRHALLSSVAFIFCTFIFLQEMQSGKSNIKLVKYFLLLSVGCFIYGRIGIVSLIVTFIIAIIYIAIRYKRLGTLIVCAFFTLVICISILANINWLTTEFKSLAWILEPIVSYMNTGHFSSASTDQLQGMYFMPSESTILFGDGIYTNSDGSYYMHSDVGFLRPLLYFGFAPLIFYYLMASLPLVYAVAWSKLRNRTFLYFSMFATLVVYEFKGESLVSFYCIVICFIVLPLSGRNVNSNLRVL